MNSIYDSHTTKSFLGIKYKRTSDYVSDNSEKYKHSQLYGDAGVTLDSQGRLRVQGVDIQTIGPVYLKGVKGVEILSGNEISSRYEVHTSKSLKIGSDKSGLFKGLKIEQDKNTKEMDNIKSIGSIINSKGSTVTIEGDNIVSVGSKIGAAGDINLIGEHGVVIKDGENFAKIREENEKIRAGMFTSWSLKNLSAGIGVEGTYNKTNDGKTIVTPEKNIIVTNKNLNIISKSGNIFMQGDFGAKEDINVKAEKGKIYIKDSKSEVLTDSRSVNARMALALGINLSGFKDTLKSYKSQLKAIKEIPNLGRVISFTRDIAKGKSLLESLDGKEDTINAISTMYNGPSTGSASAGLDVTGNINVSKSISKYLQNITTTIRAGKDITFKSKEFETEGSFIRAENNLKIDASKILIQASADKYATNSKNMGANFGVTLTGTNSVSGGLNYGQMNSKGTLYNNAQIQAGNKLIVKADNMTIRGGKNIELRTGKLEYSDIYDKDKGYDIGLNSKATISKNDKDEWNMSKTIGLDFGAKDKEQINRATIGAGTIIVGGKVVNPDINRNESVAQEVTKNINVDGISVEYKDNRRRWSDISDIMGEYGKSLGSDLDKMSGGKYNLENKLSIGISNFVFEVEKVLDHHLGNKYIGLIPTKEYRGGIIGQFQEFKTRYFDGTQKLYITETKIMKDEKGHTMFDKDGVPLLSTKTRELKPGETVGKDVRKVVTLNGVFNNKMEAIAGGLASTITANENKALLAGKTIKSVVIHNESGSLVVDATETLVTKFGGLLWNQNWGAKKLEGMFKDNPWIMAKMNWHSQGSIYGAAAMIHFLDTEEGKAIAEKNLGVIGIKGIAITALGYGKLDRRMKALKTGAQLYYMRNIGDWVSFIAAQGMKRNTNGYWHDNIGYNDDNYTWNKKSGIYERKTITVIRDGEEEEIVVPNYNYKIGEMDGKDMRSIIERWEDKRTQEKWYGGK